MVTVKHVGENIICSCMAAIGTRNAAQRVVGMDLTIYQQWSETENKLISATFHDCGQIVQFIFHLFTALVVKTGPAYIDV